jgi:hypothetical protein
MDVCVPSSPTLSGTLSSHFETFGLFDKVADKVFRQSLQTFAIMRIADWPVITLGILDYAE